MNAMFLDLLARSPRAVQALDVTSKATLVLAVAGVAALALHRASAAARHLAWCLGLCAALALPVLSLVLPGWAWRILPMAGRRSPSRSDFQSRRPGPAARAVAPPIESARRIRPRRGRPFWERPGHRLLVPTDARKPDRAGVRSVVARLCAVVVVAVDGLAGRGARGPVGPGSPDGSR